MKYILFISLCISTFLIQAQNPQDVDFQQLEAQATQILERSKGVINDFEGIEAEFTMVVEIPDQERMVEKGKLIQQGDKYILDMPDKKVVSDGQTIWNYMKDINEVHISDLADAAEGEINTPLDWMKIYENGDYVYALVNKVSDKGKTLDQIEFKSNDRNSEFSKVRLTVDEKSLPNLLEFFFKDGVKMTIHMDALYSYFNAAPDFFMFDPSAHEGVHVEDLRF